MAVAAVTSLFDWIELISRSPNKLRSSLLGKVNLNHLKERVALLLNTLKHLDSKFEDDERMKIGKEQIRVTAFELEYSLHAVWIADLSRKKIHKMLLAIAKEIDSMNQHLLTCSRPKFLNLEEKMSEDANFPSSRDSVSSSEVASSSLGLEESFNRLLLQLTGSERKLEMLGIVGMAGIGKTTLAKMIFQDRCVIQHFDIRAWVKISQSHSKRDLLLQVLKCINQQNKDDVLGQTEASLEEDLYRSLKQKRYLIVVDDLWSVQPWNEMRRLYSDDNKGSRIIFTSRQSNVIEDLNCNMIHQMSLLDENTSWNLLQNKVFGQDACPLSLVETGKQIAKKCQGLPLAIVVISGVLLKINKKMENWKVIADSFSSLVLGSANPCQEMFALSYKHLPAHLKSCFLYMGAFPGGGFEIEAQVLERLWIAEGFVVPQDMENLEQVADEYLKELIDRSLVLTASKRSNGNVKTCRLHDLLLEFCIKQSRHDKFLDVIRNIGEEEDLGGEEDIGEVLRENHSKKRNHRPSRFSFHCMTYEGIPPKSQAHTALFTVSSSEVPDILLYDLEFKLLVVLDMIPLRFDSFPEEQVSKFLLLKYLALTAAFELPSVVFRLLKLQSLIVYDSRLKSDTTAALELPLEFWGSINLRHMQLQVANKLPPPDDEFSVTQMVSLRTLSKVTLSSCFTPESFARIPNITKLAVSETMADFRADSLWNRFFENLVLLSHLETLKVFCLQMNNCSPRVLPIPSPNAFPERLRKLTLSRSHLPWEKMKILSELPNLEVLKLRNYAFQGPEWDTEGGGFQSLRYLLIENTDLEHWSLESEDYFPRLQQLVMKFCHSLEEIPEQIGDIPSLSCMVLHFCSNTAERSVEMIKKEQEEEYFHDIEVHIRRKISE